jgi:hypothetical protein
MVSLDRKHIYDYHVDDQGNWFCEGNPVADQQLFCMLSRSLYEQGGRYFIRCEGEVHPVRVDDAPIWIRYVHLEKDRLGSLLRVDIELEDGRREPLAAETLTVVNNRALYCLATRRRLKARFGRVAYYELTQHLQTDDQGPSFYLTIDGRRYPIHPEPRIQEPGVRSRNGEYCELVRE